MTRNTRREGSGSVRRRWIEAELQCLLCGGLVGTIAQPRDRVEEVDWSSAESEFRPVARGTAQGAVVGGEWPRCSACGGSAALGKLRTYMKYEEIDGGGRAPPGSPWLNIDGVSKSTPAA